MLMLLRSLGGRRGRRSGGESDDVGRSAARPGRRSRLLVLAVLDEAQEGLDGLANVVVVEELLEELGSEGAEGVPGAVGEILGLVPAVGLSFEAPRREKGGAGWTRVWKSSESRRSLRAWAATRRSSVLRRPWCMSR